MNARTASHPQASASLAVGPVESGVGPGPLVSRSAVRDLSGTAMLTALATASAFGVVALLARWLEPARFLEFSVVNRYLGFFAIAANLGMAYAFIRFSDGAGEARWKGVGVLCRRYVARAVTLLLPVWCVGVLIWNVVGAPSGGILPLVLTFVWVGSQAQYHLSAPYARRVDGFGGYRRLIVWTKIVAPVVGAGMGALTGRYEIYFVVFATISLGFQHALWRGAGTSTAEADGPAVLTFSRSRWVENVIRSATPVAFVFCAQLALGAAAAGSVALVFTVAKAIESLLQPLVVAMMMQVGTADRRRSGLLLSLLVAASLSLLVYLSEGLVLGLVGVFLGKGLAYLGAEVWIVLLSAGPIVSLSLLRALNDNKLDSSPLLPINALCAVSVPFVFLFVETLTGVAVAISVIQLVRYLLYCAALGTRLR